MTHSHRFGIAGLVLAAGASATPTIEFLPPGYLATDASYDGSVLVGNVQGDGSFETFRWTAETGVERLGRATVPAIGVGGGSPDVSYDGTRVSASILSSDNLETQGIWDLEEGWTEAMPPPPPDGVILDQSYGSTWGLSGDGTTLTGFYWRMGPGSAKPNTWSQAGGITPLQSAAGRSARVNASDFDADVVVGWEAAMDGVWQPAVWRGQVRSVLAQTPPGGQASGVTGDGATIVGHSYNTATATMNAAIWRWNGSSYTTELLGALPGTIFNSGSARLSSVADSGELAGGTNLYTLNPGGPVDGVIWTPATGLVKDTVWLASLGLSVPPGSDIRDLNVVSPDGNVVVGIMLTVDSGFQSFVVRLSNCPADVNGDEVVDFGDLNLLLGNYNTAGWGSPGDVNADGVVDFSDLNTMLGAYNTTCP